MTSSHSAVLTLSGQITARTSSSRISAAVPGSEPSPASRNSARKSGKARPSVFAPCQTSSGEKACTCMPGSACFDRAADREIGRAGIFRVDAALQADFGGAALPGLLAAPDDFVEVEIVGPAAQILAELALREGAELAAEIADIGVVDVAGDDIGDGVARHLAAQPVGGGADFVRNRRRAPANRRTISASVRVSPAAARSRMSDRSGNTLTPALPRKRGREFAAAETDSFPSPASGGGLGWGLCSGASVPEPAIHGSGRAKPWRVDQRAAPECAAPASSQRAGSCA